MAKKALVLGGGGLVGLAWESAVVAGLEAGGTAVHTADIIVGTSAGSLLGSQIAGGAFDFSFERYDNPVNSRGNPPLDGLYDVLDMGVMEKIFTLWQAADPMTRTAAQQIGELALQASTWSENNWMEEIAELHGMTSWPQRDLRLISVDASSGDRIVNHSLSAPFNASVAASCAIPGMFPTISVNGVAQMDGGVASGTNADVVHADQPDLVIAIAPICEGTAIFGRAAEKSLLRECEELEAAGARVLPITPDERDIDALGDNLMDMSRMLGAAEVGYAKGREIAKSAVAEFWRSDRV